MKKLRLTPEMQKAMDIINEHGKLKRYRGGYWAQEGAKMKLLNSLEDTIIPKDSVGTPTVEALARRGLIEPSYWRNLPSGIFIVEYKIANNESPHKETESQKGC